MLAICGAGNAGHALVVAAARAGGLEVGWLTSSDDTAQQLRDSAAHGVRATGAMSGPEGRVHVISADPAEIIPAADLVIITLPAHAHRHILDRIVPHLRRDAVLAFVAARAGLEFEVAKSVPGIAPYGGRRILGLQTLPWLCRVRQPGRLVEVLGVKSRVLAATLPAGSAADLASRMTALLGIPIVATPNFLNLTLGNPGQVIHPGCMYAHFGSVSQPSYGADEIPHFYEALDEKSAELMDSLSSEAVGVARSLEAASGGRLDLGGVLPIQQWIRMSYAGLIADDTTLASCFRSNRAYQGILAPMREHAPGRFHPDFGHRFLTEDVPFGLVVVRALADLVGTRTPRIDEVIRWAERQMGRQYLEGGQLWGRDVPPLRIPQNYGIRSVEALITAVA